MSFSAPHGLSSASERFAGAGCAGSRVSSVEHASGWEDASAPAIITHDPILRPHMSRLDRKRALRTRRWH
jgi:hypothetical protein